MQKIKLAIIFIIALLLLVPVSAFAIDQWATTNQATVGWDNDPTNITTATERYINVVYLANYRTDPTKANPVEVGRTPDEQLTITIGVKGMYLAGVKVVFEIQEADGITWTQVTESTMNWSDDPIGNFNDVTFGIRFYPSPNAPGNFRPL